MNLLPPALLFILTLSSTAFSSEPIDLKNSRGKSIRAELISLDPVTNTIRYKRLRDGRIFTSAVGIFDGPTQERLNSFPLTEAQPVAVSITASQKLVYDHAKDVWKEPTPEEARHSSRDIYRSVFKLENNNKEDLKNLKVDIVVAISSKANNEPLRQERQTFSIMRLPGTGAIQVQSKRYEIHSTGNEADRLEFVSGTALRLRNAETDETILEWETESLSRTPLLWKKTEQTATGLTALITK